MNLLHHSVIYCLFISSVVTNCMEKKSDLNHPPYNIKQEHKNAKRRTTDHESYNHGAKRKLTFVDTPEENKKWPSEGLPVFNHPAEESEELPDAAEESERLPDANSIVVAMANLNTKKNNYFPTLRKNERQDKNN